MFDAKEKGIRELALFRDCSAAEIRWIARIGDVIDVPAGRVIALEGETVREAFVLIGGVASAQDGDVLLGRGAWHGAAEIESARPAAMTVESLCPVRLLVFGIRELRALLNRIPSVRRRLVPAVVQPVGADRMLRAVS